MTRAVDVVRRIAPRARPTYVAAFERGDALLIAHGVTTPARLTHFLAQVLHESGALEIDWENMSYSSGRLLQIFGAGCHSAAVACRGAGAGAPAGSDSGARLRSRQSAKGPGARQYPVGRRLLLPRRRAPADHRPHQLSPHGAKEQDQTEPVGTGKRGASSFAPWRRTAWPRPHK